MLQNTRFKITLAAVSMVAVAALTRHLGSKHEPQEGSTSSASAPQGMSVHGSSSENQGRGVAGGSTGSGVTSAAPTAALSSASQGAETGRKPSSSVAPASLSAPAAAAGGAPAAPTAAPAPVASCGVVSFQHAKTLGHADLEDCSQHRNLIRLAAPKTGEIFKGSLCVKVNGKPVSFRYESAKRELLLPPVAGPDSTITVRYCTAPSRCEDPCTPERDDFLEAIAGNDDENAADVQNAWGSGESALKLSEKLSEELGHYGELRTFSEWKEKPAPQNSLTDSPVAQSCTLTSKKVARK